MSAEPADLPTSVKCDNCNGTGWRPVGPVTCGVCNGTGSRPVVYTLFSGACDLWRVRGFFCNGVDLDTTSQAYQGPWGTREAADAAMSRLPLEAHATRFGILRGEET